MISIGKGHHVPAYQTLFNLIAIEIALQLRHLLSLALITLESHNPLVFVFQDILYQEMDCAKNAYPLVQLVIDFSVFHA